MQTLTLDKLQSLINEIKYERKGCIPYRTYCLVTHTTPITDDSAFKLTVTDGYFDRPFYLPSTINYSQVTLKTVLEQFWEDSEYEIMMFHYNNMSI